MPYKDPEKRKQYQKAYQEKNREELLKKRKEYENENKEKILQQKKEYHKKNREVILKKQKEYYKENKEYFSQLNKKFLETPEGKKSKKISLWTSRGVICDDFDLLYDKYINTTHCEECNILLTKDRYNTVTTKCLDHNHETGEFRNILCNSCNIKRR